MVVKIQPITGRKPPRKLADAELQFTDGELEGLKLVGFAVWERESGDGLNVTFPAQPYTVGGARLRYALLRPTKDGEAEKRVRSLVLDAYAAFEQQAPEATDEDGFLLEPGHQESGE